MRTLTRTTTCNSVLEHLYNGTVECVHKRIYNYVQGSSLIKIVPYIVPNDVCHIQRFSGRLRPPGPCCFKAEEINFVVIVCPIVFV